MASSYSSSLNLELQATGENSGTWGNITNNNLQKVESAIKGYVSVAIASTTDSLTATDGSTTDEQSNAIIKLTGTLTGNTTIQCEAVETWYIVDNATTMSSHTLGFNDRVGIKTNSPSTELHVVGGVKATGAIDFDGGGFTFNESGASVDLRAETNTLTHAFFIDGSADKIGFGTDSPANASVEINQANSSGAIACLSLDQDDQDQEFIYFDGTSASDSSASVSSSTGETASKAGAIRVNINGTDRWIRFYESAV